MSDPDPEIESLIAKRLAEMRNNISRSSKEDGRSEAANPREILIARLGYRGLEVLKNAEAQRPRETAIVINKLAELIRGGELRETIEGGDLLALFASLGIRIRMQTKISVESDGKLVSLSEKLSAAKADVDDDA